MNCLPQSKLFCRAGGETLIQAYLDRQHWRERHRMEKRKSVLRFVLSISLQLGVFAFLFPRALQAQEAATPLAAAPKVRAHDHVAALTLHAVRGNDGRDSFAFNGQTIPPIIRVSPGDTLK